MPVWAVLRALDRRGIRRRLELVSPRRGFALELRIDPVVLFALAALTVTSHSSIMLTGFALGLLVAAIGEPRRLTRPSFPPSFRQSFTPLSPGSARASG